jgi:peptide/nickel transport system substrate-binding protein
MIDDVPMVPLFFTAGVGMWRIDRFTGWPSANDPYAVSIGNGPNTELILLRLTRKR